MSAVSSSTICIGKYLLSVVDILPIWQSFPVNPALQLHRYWLTLSTHFPFPLQNCPSQSSMSGKMQAFVWADWIKDIYWITRYCTSREGFFFFSSFFLFYTTGKNPPNVKYRAQMGKWTLFLAFTKIGRVHDSSQYQIQVLSLPSSNIISIVQQYYNQERKDMIGFVRS